MTAMLEEPNDERYLHKNKIYFPKENHYIVSLLQYGRRERTLFTKPNTVFSFSFNLVLVSLGRF